MKIIVILILAFSVFNLQAQNNKKEEDLLPRLQMKTIEQHFKRHPKLTILIDSIEIENVKYSANFYYKGKIKTQTGLLKINDSLALNVIFLKVKLEGSSNYYYLYSFYRKGLDNNWIDIQNYQSFSKITPNSYVNGWGGIGYRGEKDSFWYKMYLKFD